MVYLAYGVPYTHGDLLRKLSVWDSSPFVVRSRLCSTLRGRDVPLLTISGPDVGHQKRNVVVVARHHPGEPPSSFVLEGLVDFLIGSHQLAVILRETCSFSIIPMMDPDGVAQGAQRSWLGSDLNRVWTNPDPSRHPTVVAAKRLIGRLVRESKVWMFLDLHGHANLEGAFFFGCPGSKGHDARVLPRICCINYPEFAWSNCQFSFPAERESCARLVVHRELGVKESFTIEASFGPMVDGRLSTPAVWRRIGRHVCKAVARFVSDTMGLKVYIAREVELLDSVSGKRPRKRRAEEDPEPVQMVTGWVAEAPPEHTFAVAPDDIRAKAPARRVSPLISPILLMPGLGGETRTEAQRAAASKRRKGRGGAPASADLTPDATGEMNRAIAPVSGEPSASSSTFGLVSQDALVPAVATRRVETFADVPSPTCPCLSALDRSEPGETEACEVPAGLEPPSAVVFPGTNASDSPGEDVRSAEAPGVPFEAFDNGDTQARGRPVLVGPERSVEESTTRDVGETPTINGPASIVGEVSVAPPLEESSDAGEWADAEKALPPLVPRSSSEAEGQEERD